MLKKPLFTRKNQDCTAKNQIGNIVFNYRFTGNSRIETADTELWKIMQRILHPYSMDFNHKYHFTGHLFESRYTACIIEDDRYFLEVSRYIHLNPVKALMVREPLAYEYSSYGLFAGDERMDDRRRWCLSP